MKTLLCQVHVTRRQDMCYILDEAGVLCWSGKYIRSAIEHLLDNDEPEFILTDDSGAKPLQIKALRM